MSISDYSWEVNESMEEIEILDPIINTGHISEEDNSDMSEVENPGELDLVSVSGDEDVNISEDHQENIIRGQKKRGMSAHLVSSGRKSKRSRSHVQVSDIDETDSIETTTSQSSTNPQDEVLHAHGPATQELLDQIAHLTNENSRLETAGQQMEQKYEDLVTNLQSKVECPVCYETPKQHPIYVCSNGHLVCSTCRRDSCPTCRVKMTGATSLLAVTVTQNIPHSCEFQVHGCTVRCEVNDLPLHQTSCRYRTVKCPNFSCSDKVPLVLLAEHVLIRCIYNGTFYSSPLVNNYNYIIPANQTGNKRPNSTWRPDGIEYDGQNFFLKITRKGKKGMWYFYIQMAGSESECKNYTVTIFVFNTKLGSDGKYSYRFIGDICPVDISSTERAAESGYCQSLTDNQMNKLFTQVSTRGADSKFGFSVKVRIEKEMETGNVQDTICNSVQNAVGSQGGEEEGFNCTSARNESHEENTREGRHVTDNMQMRQRTIVRRDEGNEAVPRGRSRVPKVSVSRQPCRLREAGEGSSMTGGAVRSFAVRHRIVLRTTESTDEDEEEDTPIISGVLLAD